MSEESLVSDGDHVAVLVRVQGTNTRAAHGFEPTGRAIDLHHIHVFQVSDSGASRWWPGRDDLALLIQLGVFVPPDRAEQVGWLHGEGGSTSGGAGRGPVTTTIERTAQGE